MLFEKDFKHFFGRAVAVLIGCGMSYYALLLYLGIQYARYFFIGGVGAIILALAGKFIFKFGEFTEHIISSVLAGFLIGIFFALFKGCC